MQLVVLLALVVWAGRMAPRGVLLKVLAVVVVLQLQWEFTLIRWRCW